MRPRCVVFHFLRHVHSDILAHAPSNFLQYIHTQFTSIHTPSFYYNTYTLNLLMLVYQLRRVLLNILKRSLYGQLHSTLFRELKCPYAWEVSHVFNSYTVIRFPGTQVSICVRAI